MEKQGKKVKFKSVILLLAARKLEGERRDTEPQVQSAGRNES